MKQNLVVFVNPELLKTERYRTFLRKYLLSEPAIEQYSKIEDVAAGYSLVTLPPMAFKDAHQNDPGLCAYDYDAVYAGYFKTTVQALMEFIS